MVRYDMEVVNALQVGIYDSLIAGREYQIIPLELTNSDACPVWSAISSLMGQEGKSPDYYTEAWRIFGAWECLVVDRLLVSSDGAELSQDQRNPRQIFDQYGNTTRSR